MTATAASPLTRHARRALQCERGSSAVSTLIITSVLILICVGGLQTGLIYMAASAARGAAQEGARVAAAETGTLTDGLTIANAFAADSGDVLTNVRATGTRTTETATVTVTATTLSVLPGIDPTVTQTAAMPVERITG